MQIQIQIQMLTHKTTKMQIQIRMLGHNTTNMQIQIQMLRHKTINIYANKIYIEEGCTKLPITNLQI